MWVGEGGSGDHFHAAAVYFADTGMKVACDTTAQTLFGCIHTSALARACKVREAGGVSQLESRKLNFPFLICFGPAAMFL